ncbi:MAG: hypothetical protein EXQ95_11110 [Alphaproteobacteria bacterium]|nr:hypothetical protein [Alphaproteobacteria bacterium]
MSDDVGIKDFLTRLNQAESAGRAKVLVDFNKVTHISSPLPFESFKGQIAYIYLALVAALAIAARWVAGLTWTDTLIGLGGISVVYWVLGRMLLERRAKRQIVARLLSDGDAWEKLWRYGGITLRIEEPSGASAWVAPADRWKDAYRHLGD